MRCPICGEEYNYEVDWCFICGFDKIRTEFVNEEERQLWLAETVEPCKAVYKTGCDAYDSLHGRYDELQDEYDELQDEYDELQDKYSDLLEMYNSIKRELELQKQLRGSTSNPVNKAGWNFDDLVPHPNYAKCSYLDDVFEIYSISGVGDTQCYKIQFLAKMLSLSPWSNGSGRVRFKWRVKNNDGIIVLTNVWCQEGLLVGDVIRGEIVLNNVGDHLYTMDFINA